MVKHRVIKIRPWFLLLVFVLALAPAALSASSGGTDPEWDLVLKRQQRYLSDRAGVIDQLGVDLTARLNSMKRSLYLLESKFDRLMLYFDMMSESALVLRDMLGMMVWFEGNTEQVTQSLRRKADSLDRQLKILSDLSAKNKEERRTISRLGSPALNLKAETYFKDLADLETRANALKKALTQGLKPAEDFVDRLKQGRLQIEEQYDRVLETYFLKPVGSYFSARTWKAGVAGISRWADNFSIYMIDPEKIGKTGWMVLGAKMTLFSLALFFLGRIALVHGVKRVVEGFVHVKFLPFYVLWSIGLGSLATVLSTGLFPPTLFVTMVTILLVLGLISLSKNLGPASGPPSTGHFSTLLPLWALVSEGALLQAFHIPEVTYIPLWAISLLLVGWYFARSMRREEGHQRAAQVITVWAMPFLALLAVMGWCNLSILVAMVLLVVFLDVQLARVLAALLARPRSVEDQTSDQISLEKPRPALGFPFIFLILLIISLAWAFTFVSGFSLFFKVLGFRVGWDKVSFSLSRIGFVCAAFFLTRIAISLARSSIAKLPGRYRDFDAGSVQSLDTIATYVLWSLFVLITLYLLGFSFRNLAVVAGGLSVGLGFGMQNIVNNFIGGLILLFGRSIQPGDLLEIGNARGTVRRITIRNTVVQTFSGSTIFVPNSELVSQRLTNWSYRDPKYRQEIGVGVAYGSDTELVTELLLQAARKSSKVLDRPPPRVRFLDFGSSTLNFSLRIWIRGWEDRYADSEVRHHIGRIFKEHGIEISFPQLDVHVKSAEGPKAMGHEAPL